MPSFVIPQIVQDKYPDLIEMLKKSESIDDEEKTYWFSALETMDDDQVESLRQILEDEQMQLTEVDEQYEEVAKQALDKTEQEVLEQQRQEIAKQRRFAEQQSRETDEDRQDELLSLLDDI
jgi:hypothetical protein